MGIDSEVLEPETKGPPEHPKSDRGVEGAVSFRCFIRATNVSLTYCNHRNTGKVAETLPKLSGEPTGVSKGSSTAVSPGGPSTGDATPKIIADEAGGCLHSEGTEGSGSLLGHPPPPTLPRAPTKCFSQETVDDVLDLTDQVASTSLVGPIGVGKSFVAHILLHDDRTKVKFGGNRHFMRCDDLTSSLEGFLERLSDVIHTDRTTNAVELQSQLESSPSFILVLDGVDLILDPLAPEAEEISATIEELGSYPHVCLVTTSRMDPNIPGFHRVEVPIPSEDGARDAFYSLCNLGRSPAVDGLIARLDFHPLSIDLLARSVHENEWDEPMLLKALDDSQTSALKENYHQSLKDAVELSFRSPTIQSLGTTARDTLQAIAAFPHGIEERILEATFPGVTGTGAAVDVLCRFSLVYRQDGFIKMLSPFRFYFLESALVPVQHTEVIRWGADCSPAPGGTPFSHDVLWVNV